MVKEKVLFDIDKFNRLKEDINVYEELMKDVVSVFGSVMNLGIHSGVSINRLIKHIGNDCIEKEGESDEFEKKCVYENNNNENININMDANDDNDMDLIRFTNNGPVFQVSTSVLDSLKGSFIEEQRNEEKRTNDGSVYLDYPGNDAFIYYLLDYLNGKKVNFDSFSYEEQLEILNLFEFCGLVIPIELIDCRIRRDRKMKKYEEGDEVSLIINGNKNDIIKDYLVQNGLWNNYVKNWDNGFINYNHKDNIFFIENKYENIDYITEYVKNGYIYIEFDKIVDINKELLEKEMIELFGEKGKEEANLCLAMKPQFSDSLILYDKEMDYQLQKWLGRNKKWQLLFRASEHNYSNDEFHRYCDNKGETLDTDQNWESPILGCGKHASKEFLFTLSNEHGIPPTPYLHNGNGCGIYCSSSYGPVFGCGYDIALDDGCDTGNEYVYTKASSFTWIDTPQKSSLFVNTAGPNKKNYFQVEDYEVWGRA
ncbi:hypothetical protein WA158_000815 [Blastocystis sp. Blastoise]